MTKSDFIQKLTEALANMPGNERVLVLEYYEEMIDDRIENGMSEEEAVAELGSIEEILKEAAPEALNSPRHVHCENMPPETGKKSFEFRYPVDALAANSVSAELHVLSAALPDGVTARVDCNLDENEECACTLENGTLKVKYRKYKQRSFSFRNLFSSSDSVITITLADPALTRGEIGASSGDIDLNGLVFTQSLGITSASGNVKARDIAVQHKCELHTASGDITASNLTCGELLEVHTVSGDADLFNIRAGKLSVGSASGDPTLIDVECDELEVNTASGDLEVRNANSSTIILGTASGDQTLLRAKCSGNIEMGSASGDLEIRDTCCDGSISLSSTSGDIRGDLQPAANYSFRAASRTGDVRVPQSSGPCLVEIHTNSGDIHF